MCDNCQHLLRENEELTNEVSGLLSQVRQQAKREQALKRMLNEVQSTDPSNAEIEIVLSNWKHHTGHARAKTPVGGKRWLVVKKALKDHTLQELLEAIEGLALVPYVGAHGRKTHGKPAERYDDVEHALRDETTIQRCRSYRTRAFKASSSVLFAELQRASATEHMYSTAFLNAVSRENGQPAA